MTIIDIPVPDVETPVETKRQINLGPLAAALIREHGFWDGTNSPAALAEVCETGDSYCLWLALAKCYGGSKASNLPDEVTEGLYDALGIPNDHERYPSEAFAWNDSHTKEEVIDFLDNAVLMVDVP